MLSLWRKYVRKSKKQESARACPVECQWFVVDGHKYDIAGGYKLAEAFGETRIEAIWRGCVNLVNDLNKMGLGG